jgi:hypothetical protein
MHWDGLPNTPGIYLITYQITEETYVGATRNLRKRIKEHLTCFGDSAWKIRLCKQTLSSEIKTLKDAFKVVKQSLSYQILLELPADCCHSLISTEEQKFIDQLKPPLNGQSFSGYSTRK